MSEVSCSSLQCWFYAKSNIFEFDRNDLQRLGGLLAITTAVGFVAFSPLMEQTPRRGAFAFLAIVPML